MQVTTLNELRAVAGLSPLPKDIIIPLAQPNNDPIAELTLDGKPVQIYKPRTTRLTKAIATIINEINVKHMMNFLSGVKNIIKDHVDEKYLDLLSEIITLNYNSISADATKDAIDALKEKHGDFYEEAVNHFIESGTNEFKALVNKEFENLGTLNDALDPGLSAVIRLMLADNDVVTKYQNWDLNEEDSNILSYMAFAGYSMILGLDKEEETTEAPVEAIEE
jgi:hypothetical protein